MSSKFFNSRGGSEVFSYIVAAFFYVAGATAAWFEGSASFELPGVLFKPLASFVVQPWLYVIGVLVFGLLFSWLIQQFCRRHKIMGYKTHAPVLVSAVFASLIPGVAGFEWWLIFGILLVLIFDSIFSASPQVPEQLGSVLVSGTLLFVMSALSLLALWFIPVMMIAFALFISFDLRRVVALLLAFCIPWFIVWGVMLMSGHTALFYAHWQYPWLSLDLPGKEIVDVGYMVFGLSILFGWMHMFFGYSSNASRQRKIHSVVLIACFFLFLGAILASGIPLSRFPLLLVPAVLCSSFFYSRIEHLGFNKLIFWAHMLSWMYLRFDFWMIPFLKDWQRIIFG